MRTQEIMTSDAVACTPSTSLKDVARLMVECDCGMVPVVDNERDQHLIVVITDRDITCRTVAEGKNPLEMPARDAMSEPVYSIRPDSSPDECIRLMEQHQVRRLPVVDEDERCIGVISQADIARSAGEHETAEVVREVSRPMEYAR